MPKISKAKMDEFLARYGASTEKISDQIKEEPLPKDMPLNRSFHAEAVLTSLQYPEKPRVTKTCKHCKDGFTTTYASVGYCSDECRRLELSKYGVDWIAEQYRTKSEVELWGGFVPPFIIPPDALAVMKYLLNQVESDLGHQIEPWSPEQSVRKPKAQPKQKDLSEPVIEPEPQLDKPSPQEHSQKEKNNLPSEQDEDLDQLLRDLDI